MVERGKECVSDQSTCTCTLYVSSSSSSPSSLLQSPPGQDSLTQAFSCHAEIGSQRWAFCDHAHCTSIRNRWQHLNSCPQRNSAAQSCDHCTTFQRLVLVHALHCSSNDCLVTLCPDAKRQLSMYTSLNAKTPKTLNRSNSFTGRSNLASNPAHFGPRQESYDDSLTSLSASQNYLQSLQELNRLGVGALPVDLVMSYTRIAEQVVGQMSFGPDPSDLFAQKPDVAVASSMPGHPAPMYPGASGVLSPIDEHPTPVPSPSCVLGEVPRQSIDRKSVV